MTIPELSPIVDAVRTVRARYVPQAEAWADAIRSGLPPVLEIDEVDEILEPARP